MSDTGCLEIQGASLDGWPLYESRLKGKLHVISKRYTQ
ncbi:IS1 family transposase, partial [Shigella flexneri]